jgi:hypothetical protein
MSPEEITDDQLTELKKQIDLLTQQIDLLTKQNNQYVAQRTQEAQRATAIAEELKKQVTAQYDLVSEQAKLPFAELAGIKAALGDTKLPEGKSGTVQIAAGTKGTALLRSKSSWLDLLDKFADELIIKLREKDAVIIIESKFDQAYQAEFILECIRNQVDNLQNLIKKVKGSLQIDTRLFAEPIAVAYGLGFVLETVNSLAKLFRVDRKIDVFSADEEAAQMLLYILEGKGKNIIANLEVFGKETLVVAKNHLNGLNSLLNEIYEGEAVLDQWKKRKEITPKDNGGKKVEEPEPALITELKAQLEAAKSLWDGLNPSKKPDVFWSQVKGKLIWDKLAGKMRVMLDVKALTHQITDSRWYRSDVTKAAGEVQIAFRIFSEDGTLEESSVYLNASKAEIININEEINVIFPKKKR